MTLANFGQFVPPPKKQKKVHSAATANKPYSSRRRPLDDTTSAIYGDELFQDSMRIERKIIISFFNPVKNSLCLDKDNFIRISENFKFLIEWFPESFEREIIDEEGMTELVRNPEFYSLYYFKTIPSPLSSFNPEKHNQFIIPVDAALESLDCILCDRAIAATCIWCNGTGKILTKIEKSDNFQLLKERVIQIVKYEFFEEQRKFANVIQAPVESENEVELNKAILKDTPPNKSLADFSQILED